MTVATTINKNRYIGNGSTKQFDFTFPVWKKNQVKVIVGNGVSEHDATSNCTVSLSNYGGCVTFSVAPPSGQIICIKRNMPFLQEDNYVNGARFNPEEVEDRFDIDCCERQDLRLEVERAIKLPDTFNGNSEDISSYLLEILSAIRDSGDVTSESVVKADGSTVYRTLSKRFGDLINVKDFGAVGNASATDATAIATARASANGSALFFPSSRGENYGIETENTYSHDGNSYNRSSGVMFVAGSRSSPSSNPHAVVFAEKFSQATRAGSGADAKNWENGALYGQLVQVTGSAYGAAVTGYAIADAPESGQIIGVHGRGYSRSSTGQVWGGWLYGAASETGCQHVIGLEININNKNASGDPGWGEPLGTSRGLVITTADGNSVPGQAAQTIGRGGNAEVGWHTGIRIDWRAIEKSIERTDGVPDNEAIHLQGARSLLLTYGGIRFGDATEESHNFNYGISFAEAFFGNYCAMLLGDHQRIVVGNSPSSSHYVEFHSEDSYVDFNNFNIRVNGTKVVGIRKTGWGLISGDESRSTFNVSTVTTEELAKRFHALVNDLKAHGLIGE